MSSRGRRLSGASFWEYHFAYPVDIWSGRIKRFAKTVEPFAVLAIAIKVVFFL
jgi:hypothetical protein